MREVILLKITTFTLGRGKLITMTPDSVPFKEQFQTSSNFFAVLMDAAGIFDSRL